MKILYAKEVATEVENWLTIEHEGENYEWVGFYNESVSGYQWYKDGKKIQDPDWADDLDMDEIFQENLKPAEMNVKNGKVEVSKK